MCQAWRYVHICGHQRGAKWYDPQTAEDCKEARRANRRHGRTGHLLRCAPLGTIAVSVAHACGKPRCHARHLLIPFGWWCHRCGQVNSPGAAQCSNLRAGFGQVPCLHEPCVECERNDPAGRR
ncbi:hypothetical protein F5X97DRAFT_337446 [Nemania serpens]|nr:hypothetical protein F5X97DRAFT_337446 [Nemania serpens]